MLCLGLGIVLVMSLAALCAPLLAPYDPNALHLDHILEPPSSMFWLGTDRLGRDVFSRLLYGGADLGMICRRLLVMASEDIGMAYPSAISIVTACVEAAQMVGLPEAAINLSQAVVLMAASPKSNASHLALVRAQADLEEMECGDVPAHLRDSHYQGAARLGYGKEYKYPHDYGGYVRQQYLPDKLYQAGVKYYQPTDNGSEAAFKKYLKELEKIK